MLTVVQQRLKILRRNKLLQAVLPLALTFTPQQRTKRLLTGSIIGLRNWCLWPSALLRSGHRLLWSNLFFHWVWVRTQSANDTIYWHRGWRPRGAAKVRMLGSPLDLSSHVHMITCKKCWPLLLGDFWSLWCSRDLIKHNANVSTTLFKRISTNHVTEFVLVYGAPKK
jgi:hypothetical protein